MISTVPINLNNRQQSSNLKKNLALFASTALSVTPASFITQVDTQNCSFEYLKNSQYEWVSGADLLTIPIVSNHSNQASPKKNYKEIYKRIRNAKWFQKAYHDMSVGEVMEIQ